MASKRHIRRKSCDGKRRYDTMVAAQVTARRATERTQSKLNAYRCTNCGGFHIGHAPVRVSVKLGLLGVAA